MKTLKNITEGFFDDADDILDDFGNKALAEPLSDLFGDRNKGTVEIEGNDLILKLKSCNWTSKEERTLPEILGYVPERIIFDGCDFDSKDVCRLAAPNMEFELNPKNFCKTIVVRNAKRMTFKLDSLNGINIEIEDPNCQFIAFLTNRGVTNCTINHPNYCNISATAKMRGIDNVVKGTTINCKGVTSLLVGCDSTKQKRIVSDTLGELYWSSTRNHTLHPPKIDEFEDKLPLKKLKNPSRITPIWVGSLNIDGFPKMDQMDVNKLMNMMDLKLNAELKGNLYINFGAFQLHLDQLRQDYYNACYTKIL